MLLSACASKSISESLQNDPVESKLNFVDIIKFDKDLARSLQSDLNEVNVVFYAKVTPNNVPERMQRWISSVENYGGKVQIQNPPNEPSPKGIFPLLSLLGTAYSVIKDRLNSQPDQHLSAAKGRNVVIELERAANGDLMVSKIKFSR